ncbi:MAG: hypothetical protein GF332_04845 [Candidatus Moranbacteria bacterium]|nr:hypothetical protein [Candidatus Moranbacteria bacterium]
MKKEYVNSTFIFNRFKKITKQKLYYWRKANLINYQKAKTETGTKFFYDLDSIKKRAKEPEQKKSESKPIFNFFRKITK